MKIIISLKDRKEIVTELSEEEYQSLKESLIGQAKMVEIDNQIINTSSIARIEPTIEQQVISKEFRLPDLGGTTRSEKERDLQKIGTIAGMERLFNKLKEQGLFGDFSSYQDWAAK